MHTREKEIFFLNALKISLAPTLQEGPFQVMFVRNQHVDAQKELHTCELESQDAARITSALADSRIQFSWSVMSTLVRTLCLCLALMTLFAWCRVSFFKLFVTVAVLRPHCVEKSDRWSPESCPAP